MDFYAAMHYIDWSTTNYQGNPGSDALICPVAVAKLGGKIYRLYTGNWGDLECHFFWSSLVFGYNGACQGYGDYIRNNLVGPWKPEELKDAASTFFIGDAVALTDPSPSYAPAEFVFWGRFSYWEVGVRSICFGVITVAAGRYQDNPPTTHTNGPNGTYWDGHVANVQVPPLSTPFAIRRFLTRDGTDTGAATWDHPVFPP
jgi:prepilin-type processing-associated H-X9-DG protein